MRFIALIYVSLVLVGLGKAQAQSLQGHWHHVKTFTLQHSSSLKDKISQGQTRVINDATLGFKFHLPTSLRTVRDKNGIEVYTQAAYDELQEIINSGLGSGLPECEAYLNIIRPLPLRKGSIRQNLAASSQNYYLREGYGFESSFVSGQEALAFTQKMFREYEARRVAAISPDRNYLVIIGSCENRRTFDVIMRTFQFTH